MPEINYFYQPLRPTLFNYIDEFSGKSKKTRSISNLTI